MFSCTVLWIGLSYLRASLIAQLVKNPPVMQESLAFNSWVRKICWRRDRLPTSVFLTFPCGSGGKESTCNVGDLGSIPGLGGSPWRRERLLTPVFWPGEFHRLYSAWGHKESDVTEQLAVSISLSSYLNILKERDVIYHVFWGENFLPCLTQI